MRAWRRCTAVWSRSSTHMSNLLPNTYLGTRVGTGTGTGEGNTYLFIWGLRDLTV